MSGSPRQDSLQMCELNQSNHLLGNHAALEEAWRRDGYWFFRDVLDHAAIGRFAAIYRNELADLGYCDREDALVRYNGASLDGFPTYMGPLAARQPWKTLMAEPTIRSFFRSLLGFEAFWLPITQYRATPPALEPRDTRLEFIHQDAMYNAGIMFRICWIPLVPIDADMGGIAVAEGMHLRGPMQTSDGLAVKPIQPHEIPADRWRRTDYRPGDVLLMDRLTPHSGLSNHSDRFRLSLDIRLALEEDRHPVIGEVTGLTDEAVTVRDDAGDHAFRLDDTTFCRNAYGQRFARKEIGEHIRIRDEVIVAADGDLAIVLRPVH